MDSLTCPKCNSTNITANNKGFGLGKAAVGGVMLGPVGLLGGMFGSKKVMITCLECGYKWKPGQKNYFVSKEKEPEKYDAIVKSNRKIRNVFLAIVVIMAISVIGYNSNQSIKYNKYINEKITSTMSNSANNFVTSYNVNGRSLTIYANENYASLSNDDKTAKLKNIYDDFSNALIYAEVNTGNVSNASDSLSDKLIVSYGNKEDSFDYAGLQSGK